MKTRRLMVMEVDFPSFVNSMGHRTFRYLYPSPIQVSGNSYRKYVDSKTSQWWCLSGGRSGGSRWKWGERLNHNRRPKLSDVYAIEGDKDEDEVWFGFRNTKEQRKRCSDDFDVEDAGGGGFRIVDGSIGFSFIYRFFRAFGWMIPAAMVSLMMGNGPHTVILSLALPIAQSSLSLIAETILGLPDDAPRPKYRRKKRSFARAPPQTWVRNENRTGKSWADANNVSAESQRTNTQNYGGWDELDNQVRIDNDVWVAPDTRSSEATGRERSKINRRMKGDTPLFLRLLIAMFPYLGFWAKLF